MRIINDTINTHNNLKCRSSHYDNILLDITVIVQVQPPCKYVTYNTLDMEHLLPSKEIIDVVLISKNQKADQKRSNDLVLADQTGRRSVVEEWEINRGAITDPFQIEQKISTPVMSSVAMQQNWVSKHWRGWTAELQTVVLIQIVSSCRTDENQDQNKDRDRSAAPTNSARRGIHDGGQTVRHQKDKNETCRSNRITRSITNSSKSDIWGVCEFSYRMSISQALDCWESSE